MHPISFCPKSCENQCVLKWQMNDLAFFLILSDLKRWEKQAVSQVAIYIYLLFPHLYLSLLPNKPACKRSQGRISSFKDSMKFKLNQSTCLR